MTFLEALKTNRPMRVTSHHHQSREEQEATDAPDLSNWWLWGLVDAEGDWIAVDAEKAAYGANYETLGLGWAKPTRDDLLAEDWQVLP